MKTPIKRWATSLMENYLQFMRVIYVQGARQCGKTTLVREVSDGDVLYKTMDSQSDLSAAQDDPTFFVKHQAKRMIIDEVQKAPHLIPAIKRVVDEDTRPGRFVLTGSSDVFSLPSVTESLAGRIANLRLSTFTVGETLALEPQFLQRLKKGEFHSSSLECSKILVLELAMRGGYPEVQTLSPDQRVLWFQEYVKALLAHDLVVLGNVQRQDALHELILILLANTSKQLNILKVSTALGLSRQTFTSYCNYLEQLFLFDRLPSWGNSDYAKLGKQSKWYASDTGLLSSLLHWDMDTVLNDADACGKLVETFVFHELSVLCSLQSEFRLSHYRDHQKREIDFILESQDCLTGIEVKAGETVRKDDFKHIIWFGANLVKEKRFLGVVLYSGSEVLSFGKGLWAFPTAMLWS